MIYLIANNLYLGKYHSFTEEDLSQFASIEKDWQKSKIKLSFPALLDIFPEALPIVKRNVQTQISEDKSTLINLRKTEHQMKNLIVEVPYQHRWFFEALIDHYYIGPTREKLQKRIKQNSFTLYLTQKPRKEELPKDGITDQDIQLAKEIPIEQFYEGQLRGYNRLVGRCEFHPDRTPSFTIYKEQNTFYCYGCNKGGDVITYIMGKFNKDFIEAVKFLLHK